MTEDEKEEDRAACAISRSWALGWFLLYLSWYVAAPAFLRIMVGREAAAWSRDFLGYTTIAGVVAGCVLINKPTKVAVLIFGVLSIIHVVVGANLLPK